MAFAFGIGVALFLIVFQQSVAFGRSEHKQDAGGVTGLVVSVGIYLGAAWLELYPVEVSAALAVVIAFGQSRKQRQDLVAWALEKASRMPFRPQLRAWCGTADSGLLSHRFRARGLSHNGRGG